MAESIVTSFSEVGSTRVIQAIENIRQAALKANKALKPLELIKIGEVGSNRVINNINKLANTATAAIARVAGLRNVQVGVTGAPQATQALTQVAQAAQQARQNLQQLGNRPVNVQVTGQAGNQIRGLNQQVGLLNGNFRRLASTLLLVRSALVALGLVGITTQFIELVDSAKTLTNLIATSTNDFEGAADRLKKIRDISNETRSPLEANVELFSRLNLVTKTLGASEEQILQFTRLTGISLALQGRSAQATAGALLQLSQALGGAVIQAQEFNSLIDGAPALLQAAARGIKAANGDVRTLRELVLTQQITNREFFEAILSQADFLEEAFSKAQSTIGQAFSNLRNNLIIFIGDLDKATGFSNALASAILLVADNLDVLTFALVTTGTALTVAFGPSILAGVATGLTRLVGFFTSITARAPSVIVSLRNIGVAFRALGVIFLSNPITAAITAVAAAVGAITIFRDEIKLGIDDVTTLGDLFRAIGQRLSTFFEAATKAIRELLIEGLKISGITDAFDNLVKFLRSFDFSIAKAIILVAKFTDTIIAGFKAIPKTIEAAFTAIPRLLADLLPFVQNFALEVTETIVNAFSGKQIPGLFGLQTLPEFKLELPRVETKPALDSVKKFASDITKPFTEALKNTTVTEDLATGLLSDAQKIARQRFVPAIPRPRPDRTKTREPLLNPDDLKEFRNLEKQLDPIFAAGKEFDEGGRLITLALTDKLIEKERAVALFDTLRKNLEAAIRPFEDFLISQQRERDLSLAVGDAFEVQTQTFDKLVQLRERGVTITEQVIATTNAEIAATVKANREANIREDLLGRIDDAARDLIATQKVLAEESTKALLTVEQANRALLEAQLRVLDGNEDFVSGVIRGLNVLELEFQDTASQVEDAFTSAFGSLENLLTDFFTGQKVSARNFALELVSDIQRILVRTFILKPIVDKLQEALPKVLDALGIPNPLQKAEQAPDLSKPSQQLIQAAQILLPVTVALSQGASELNAAGPQLVTGGSLLASAGSALGGVAPALAGAGSIVQTAGFALDQASKELAVVAQQILAAAAALLAAAKAAKQSGGSGNTGQAGGFVGGFLGNFASNFSFTKINAAPSGTGTGSTGAGGFGNNFGTGTAIGAVVSAAIQFSIDRANKKRDKEVAKLVERSQQPPPRFPGFRDGGEVTVPGSGAPDSRVFSARVSPGEKIIFRTAAQQREDRRRAAGVVEIDLPQFRKIQSEQNRPITFATRSDFGGNADKLPGFQTGGEFNVGGSVTQISRTVERNITTIQPGSQQSERQGKPPIVVNAPITVVTPDVQSFGLSKSQILADVGLALGQAIRRNS